MAIIRSGFVVDYYKILEYNSGTLSMCVPSNDLRIILYSSVGDDVLDFPGQVLFNKERKKFSFFIQPYPDVNFTDIFSVDSMYYHEINMTEFTQANFSMKIEFSDKTPNNDDWKIDFEGNKWPSEIDNFPSYTKPVRYYRMLYTNFAKLINLMKYDISISVTGTVELFFNGVKFVSDSENSKINSRIRNLAPSLFTFSIPGTSIRDGINYIAFSVSREDFENIVNDDIQVEINPIEDINNCVDASCTRQFCQTGLNTLNAEVGSFYLDECPAGFIGNMKYSCKLIGGIPQFTEENNCNQIPTAFIYTADNTLSFNNEFAEYNPTLIDGTVHSYYTLSDSLPTGIEFDIETGKFSGTSSETLTKNILITMNLPEPNERLFKTVTISI